MSTAKYTVTLFTPDIHEHHLHPQVKMADQVLPLENKPNVLGVTLDTYFTFTQHCNNIALKMQQRNNVLKAQAGSTCGCDIKPCYRSTRQLVVQYSATAAPTGRHHLGKLTGAGSNGHKICLRELPLAVLRWQMSPYCIKRLGNYQLASITN